MSSGNDRAAENQRSFREANQRLRELASVADGALTPFLCECVLERTDRYEVVSKA